MADGPRQPADYRTWKHWDAERFGQVGPVDSRYFEAEFAAAGIDLDKQVSLLEIGFGNAELAAWARARDWRYSGTELDKELVQRARAVGLDAHPADTPLAEIAPGTELDLVVAFDVLEHLSADEIIGLLGSIRTRLKPTGRLLARFPSGDSPFSRAIQHGDFTHKTTIGSGIVEQLALRTGFRVLQIRHPVFPLTGLGLRRLLRRLPITISRALVRRLCRLIYFDNRPRVVDPNMIIVLEPMPAAEHVPGGRGS